MAKSVNWEYYNESYQGSHNQSRQPFSRTSSGDVMMGMKDIKADESELGTADDDDVENVGCFKTGNCQ